VLRFEHKGAEGADFRSHPWGRSVSQCRVPYSGTLIPVRPSRLHRAGQGRQGRQHRQLFWHPPRLRL